MLFENMPRRSQRKRAGTSSGGTAEAENGAAGSVAKSPRVSPDVVWEWEGDSGQWNQYSQPHADEITDALVSSEEEASLQVTPTIKMKIRFSTMTQMNVSTGWQRNARCLPKNATTTRTGVWEFRETPADPWTAYSAPIQRQLDACYFCGVGSVARVEALRGKWFKVDIKGMKQVCEETEDEWIVQRSDPIVWQWQDEHGQWRDYEPNAGSKIEAAHSQGVCGGTTSFSASGRGYRVDTNKMEQVNSSTGVVRKIQRLGPVAAATAPTAPKATASETSTTTDKTSSSSKTSSTHKAKTRSTGKASSDASSSGASGTGDSTDGAGHVTTFGGKALVDYACTQKIGKAHVYCEGTDVWDATLNQTNLRNNNNKFYILQLLEDNSTGRFSIWFRWGRVGKTGQHMLIECGTDLDTAKSHFIKKFSDKTLNQWEDRNSFVKHAGKYDLLSMDYEPKDEPDVGDEVDEEPAAKLKTPDSKLDKRLQSLIELICNIQAMEDMVVEMKYDTKKAPLGKLTTDQIRSGYAALKKIEDCITRKDFADQLVQACDAFYTRIPHNFGMQRPPLIRTEEHVREKLALLEALGDIEIAMRVLSKGAGREEHPIDGHYRGLNCQLSPIDHEDDSFKLVEKYIRQTHAKTHNQYHLEVLDVFEVDRQGEKEGFKDVGNRQLLWHGSRLTNWVGILSQGLRIAPPEAPVTGYMFGKGVYFADIASKSTNYCFASPSKNVGVALLCEVALGQTNDLLAADYSADKLPRGKHSTRGLGRVAPDPAHNETLPNSCIVPLGTTVDTGVHNPRGYTLNYNEYVVYDTAQVKMQYLVKLTFHFK